MTRIETNPKGKVEAFINQLRRENPDFDKHLANAWNYALLRDRKGWGIAQLRLLRTGYKAGIKEGSSPANES